MVDEELGVKLSLKNKQATVSGIKDTKQAIHDVGTESEKAGTKAQQASPKFKTMSDRLQGVGNGAKRAGKVTGAMFGVIVANSQGALGPIQEVYDKLQGVGTQLEGGKSKAAKWMVGIGAAMTGAGAVLGTIASKEQTAEGQLRSAIEGAGGSYEDYEKQIRKNIKTGEHYGNTAATTMSVLNRLTIATHNPRKAMDLYNSVLQIAAARHMNVERVALTVGRAVNGQTRSLAAFGFNLKDANKAQQTLTRSQKEHQSAIEGVKKAQEALRDTQARLGAGKTAHGSSTALASAHLSVESATNSASKALYKYGAGTEQARMAQERLSIAQAHYNDTLAASHKSGGLSISQQITLRHARENLAEAQKKLIASNKNLKKSQDDVKGSGDIVNQVVQQTNKYMGGQADAAANTFTGHMRAMAAVIDDKVASAGGKMVKWLVMLGPVMMGVGAIMESGIIGKTGRGVKALIGFRNAEGEVRAWSIKNMVTQTANGVKVAAIWVFQTAKLVAHKAVTAAITGATKAYTAAQWLLNAAMNANPIGLIIGLVVVLAAGFYLLYRRSETFRKIVQGAFHAVLGAARAAWGWIKKNWPYLVGILGGPFALAVVFALKHWHQITRFFKGLPGTLKSIGGDITDALFWPFKTAFNMIADAWNNTAGKLHFHVPGWVPKIGGDGFSMPTIPKAHTGGTVESSGLVNIQPSEEIVYLPRGATVQPIDKTLDANLVGGGSNGPIVLQVVMDRKVIAEAVYDDIKDKAARR